MRIVPSRTRAPAVAAALVALSLGLAACGGGTEVDEQVDAGSSDAAAALPDGPVLDASVFQGQATTIEGASFDLEPLANQDLIVWFWAPW